MSTENNSLNTTPIPAGQALEALKVLWEAQQNVGMKVSSMMWGRPGIGKTQVAEALAKFIGGKLYDVRLTTIDSADLNGLPYYNHDTKTTEWYRPQDLPREGEGPAVLFLDELSSAPAHIQPTVYGLLQERRVGQHKIPDDVIILAAGNQITDGAVAYEMGTAIADRLVHFHVIATPEDWVANYAVPQGLHPSVIAYIKTRPDHFENSVESMAADKMIATTPRSWDRVSQIMFAVKDKFMQRILVAGTVGDSVSSEFFIVADDISATVKVDEMIKTKREDRMKMVPTSMHGLQAMTFGIVGALTKETLTPITQIIADLADTDAFFKQRNAEDAREFKKMPIKELATFAMETVMNKIIEDNDMTQIFIASPEYAAYQAQRTELGL